MGKRLFMAGLLLAAGLIAFSSAEEGKSAVKDNKLTFSFPDLRGKTVNHDDSRFRDKVVLVDIWGSWCPPCREEIPTLIRLHEKYERQGLEVVGIAFEKKGNDKEKLENLKAFVKDNKINYTVLFGGSTVARPGRLTSLQNFEGYPTTIFIGRDGKVRKIEVGFDDSMAEEMERTVVDLLKER